MKIRIIMFTFIWMFCSINPLHAGKILLSNVDVNGFTVINRTSGVFEDKNLGTYNKCTIYGIGNENDLETQFSFPVPKPAEDQQVGTEYVIPDGKYSRIAVSCGGQPTLTVCYDRKDQKNEDKFIKITPASTMVISLTEKGEWAPGYVSEERPEAHCTIVNEFEIEKEK